MCLKIQSTPIVLNGLSVNVKSSNILGRSEEIKSGQNPQILDSNSTEAINKGIPAAELNFSGEQEPATDHSTNKIAAHVGSAIASGISGVAFSSVTKYPEMILKVISTHKSLEYDLLGKKLADTAFLFKETEAVKVSTSTVGKFYQTTVKVTQNIGSKSVDKTAGKLIDTAFEMRNTTSSLLRINNRPVSKLATALPFVGVALNTGITVWDAHDALQKQRNSEISNQRKVMAWATVGLDMISTGAQIVTAAGIARGNLYASATAGAISLTAGGLSIATSLASDYLK
jgi:hypothetical protein